PTCGPAPAGTTNSAATAMTRRAASTSGAWPLQSPTWGSQSASRNRPPNRPPRPSGSTNRSRWTTPSATGAGSFARPGLSLSTEEEGPMRENPELDDVFLNHTGDGPARKPTRLRKRRATGGRDKTRRLAFRVLALLAGLDAPGRERVLKAALR